MMNRHADAGHTRRVRHRQVVAAGERRSVHHRHLAAHVSLRHTIVGRDHLDTREGVQDVHDLLPLLGVRRGDGDVANDRALRGPYDVDPTNVRAGLADRGHDASEVSDR
jgi:hypothetical protein